MPDLQTKTFGLPIYTVESTSTGKRYIVDLTGVVSVSFHKKNDSNDPLELEVTFTAAGVKVPANSPRPVGVAVGVVSLEMEAEIEQMTYQAVVEIKEKTQLSLFLVNSEGVELPSGNFILQVPVAKATYKELS